MSLRGIADQTLSISDSGFYEVCGRRVDIGVTQRAAIAGTRLYRPDELKELEAGPGREERFTETAIHVSSEKTQEAARRLVQIEGAEDLLILSFASARNVGGGFRRGAKAQEEDLAKCSGLYRCLETQPIYYETNRIEESLLYTDHMIYSPQVPWFRLQNRDLLNKPYIASVITAPAPNAGEHLRRNPDGQTDVTQTLQRRAGYVLALAEATQHTSLLLGAWGCGVFRNDPMMVADAFISLLESERFQGSFRRVDFAVWDSTKQQATLQAFQDRMSSYRMGMNEAAAQQTVAADGASPRS